MIHALYNSIHTLRRKVNSGIISLWFYFTKSRVFIDDITLTAEVEIKSNTSWELKLEE